MNETSRTIGELEADLMQYHQAYAFGDIDRVEFEAAKAKLTQAIEARRLVIAKQKEGRALDELLRTGKIDKHTWYRSICLIARAESQDKLNELIQPLKNAA